MPTQVLMEKIEDSLVPTDEESIVAIRQIPEHSIVKIQVSVPRNIKKHRLFFAMLKLVFENQPEPRQFPTQDKLLDALKIATGHVREVRDLLGNTHIVPDSIAFGRMDEIAFSQLFESFKQVIFERIIPGVRSRDFEQRLADLLKEPGPDQIERN